MVRFARSRARYTWPLDGLRLPRDPWWLNIYVILSSILSQTVSVIIFYMHPNQKPLPRSKAKQCVAAVSNNKHIQKMVMIMPFFQASQLTETNIRVDEWLDCAGSVTARRESLFTIYALHTGTDSRRGGWHKNERTATPRKGVIEWE